MLNLAGNDICLHGSLLLSTALSKGNGQDCKLQVLNMDGNPLGEEGGYALSESLRTNGHLKEIDLSNTSIGINTLLSIADALTHDNRSVEVVKVANPLLTTLEAEHVLYFARMLACNPGIKELDLRKHVIRDEAFDILLDFGVCRNSTLRTLNLSGCQLTQGSASNIKRLLTENTSLAHLDLSKNPLTDEVAPHIAAGLRANKTLASINLQSCKFTDKGLSELAQAVFAPPRTLKGVNLWGNYFGQVSRGIFSKAMGTSPIVADFKTYEVDGSIHVAAVGT